MEFLHQFAPSLPLIPRDIYNHNATSRRVSRQGKSPIEALMDHLKEQELSYRIAVGEDNRVQHIFITLPECLKHLQFNYDVILIDNTYRTNRFNMPLFDVIGSLFEQ
jgi:hypothetical protein